MGIPLEDAVLAATENPAESIGVEKDYGRIAVGNYGNLLLVDKDLQIKNISSKRENNVRMKITDMVVSAQFFNFFSDFS